MINETTLIKSRTQLRSPPRRSTPRHSTPPPAASGPSHLSEELSEEDVSVSSVYCEQQRLSSEQEHMPTKLQSIMLE